MKMASYFSSIQKCTYILERYMQVVIQNQFKSGTFSFCRNMPTKSYVLKGSALYLPWTSAENYIHKIIFKKKARLWL